MREIAHGLLQFFDGIFLLYWGVSSIEILSMIATGGIASVVSDFDIILKLLLTLVGLMYAGFRLFREIYIWKIDREIKKQDLREKILKNNDLEKK